MGTPSENKNQVHRSRDERDPSAFSPKPELDEKKNGGLRGGDKQQGGLQDDDSPNNGINNPTMNKLDQQNADHDPHGIGQKQDGKPKGDFKPPKKPSGPYDRDE